jgi:PAN domain
MEDNRIMTAWLVWTLLFTSAVSLAAEDPFEGIGVSKDYVPEGKPRRKPGIATVGRCQTACSADTRCKAFAFRTTKPTCYFYSTVYMGVSKKSRKLGVYSSGLSIVPKQGFVSAFKRTSFPAPPGMLNPQP